MTPQWTETTTASYLAKIPRDAGEIPAGSIVVHNTVRPTRRLGARGFRAWLDEPGSRYELCTCEWAPELGGHYRVAGVPREFPRADQTPPESAD